MILTGHHTRSRAEPDTGEYPPGTDPDTTTPHPDTHIHAAPDADTDTPMPDSGAGAAGGGAAGGGGVAVLIPVTGIIRTIAWEPDVLALAQREIGAATLERLSLGRSLVAGGLRIWIEQDGLLTGRKPNPRASALLIAAFAQQLQRVRVQTPIFLGDALLCGLNSGLSDTEAAAVTRTATDLTRRVTVHQNIHPDATHHPAHRAAPATHRRRHRGQR